MSLTPSSLDAGQLDAAEDVDPVEEESVDEEPVDDVAGTFSEGLLEPPSEEVLDGAAAPSELLEPAVAASFDEAEERESLR